MITVSLKEIYDAVVRLTGRVDVLIEAQSHTASDVIDHETRIRALERGRWPLPSIAVLTSLAALVLNFVLR